MVVLGSAYMIGNRVHNLWFRAVSVAVIAYLPLAVRVIRAQPVKGYDVKYYNATIRLDRAADSIFGDVTMGARADSAITSVLQFAKYLTIDSVYIMGGVRSSISWIDTSTGQYAVAFPSAIAPGTAFSVRTFYHGKGTPEQDSWSWGGVTDKDTMMFAMGVGFAIPYTGCTRYWLPCYDLPDDKADSVDLTFICPASDVTASNGTLISTFLTPKATRIMHWHVSHPIATYLLTFATGPYTVQEIPNSLGLPFEVYALQKDSIKTAAEMNGRVSGILAFYDSLFAPYPFEKVGYVVTPIGSMEHQTMICLDTGVLIGNPATDTTSASTTAIHELSHQWWGDRVTCKTFDDAWLNEGFACYCESLSLEHLFGREKYISRQQANIKGAKQSNLPLFGAATANRHVNNYPPVIYSKGASVLGMLRQYLGDSVFFNAARYYGNTHAYSTATSYDLWNDFDTISGQDLGWFFKPWVFGIGYPKDTIVWSKQSAGATISFHQAKYNDTTNYFRLAIPVKGSTKSGLVKTDTVWMDSTQTSTATANFGFQPDTVIFDPDGLLLWKIVKLTETAPGSVSPAAAIQPDGLTLGVFPNPDNKQIIEIELNCARPLGEIALLICDESGKILRSENFATEDDQDEHTTSLNGLASGNYIVIARSRNEQVSQKITLAQ